MKTYPSIPRRVRGKRAPAQLHIFDKLDGSNLRFEWTQKDGWGRFGSRRRLLTQDHPFLGQGWRLFMERLSAPLERTAKAQGWSAMMAFAELWGPGSLAGRHVPGDAMRLSLFDVAVHKRGMLSPERFLELFGQLDVPRYLGLHTFDEDFIERVRKGALEGISFEGVVGKAGEGPRLVMAKAKTQAWIDAVLKRYGAEEGGALIES